MKKTLYDYVGIAQTASEDEIIRSYKRQMAHYNALLQKGDPSAKSMILILNDANRVLLDPIKRFEYDNKIEYDRNNELNKPVYKNKKNPLLKTQNIEFTQAFSERLQFFNHFYEKLIFLAKNHLIFVRNFLILSGIFIMLYAINPLPYISQRNI